MKGIFCVAAERVLQDAKSRRMSVINILEPAVANGFPVLVPEMAVLALWEREEQEAEEYSGRFFVRLNGETLMNQGVDVHFRGTVRNRMTTTIRGLEIAAPGTLSFAYELENGESVEYSLLVSAAEGAEDVAPDPPPIDPGEGV